MKAFIFFILFLSLCTDAFADSYSAETGRAYITPSVNYLLLSAESNKRRGCPGQPETSPKDPRKKRNASSPKWLEAVGKFTYTTDEYKNRPRICSLTLVNDEPGKDSIIAVTAGHCLRHTKSSRGFHLDEYPIKVSFLSHQGEKIERDISKIFHLQMGQGDFAIVKLDRAIAESTIKPLLLAPDYYANLLAKDYYAKNFKPYGTMAGYSTDQGIGQCGEVLTYDERCQINGGGKGRKKTLCHVYPGASGGAFAITAEIGEEDALEEWEVEKRTYYAGVIKSNDYLDESSEEFGYELKEVRYDFSGEEIRLKGNPAVTFFTELRYFRMKISKIFQCIDPYTFKVKSSTYCSDLD